MSEHSDLSEHEPDAFKEQSHDTSGSEGDTPGASLVDLQTFARHVTRRCSCSDVSKRSRFERKSLVAWAAKRGKLIDPQYFKRFIAPLKEMPSGQEHQVFFASERGRVLKITRPPRFGSRWYLEDYINNLVWSNMLFEDDIQLEGILKTDRGLSIAISQPFVLGRSPTNLEIEQWFLAQNYIKRDLRTWEDVSTGIVVDDAHFGNFIVTDENIMVPIDLQIFDHKNVLSAGL